VHERYNFKISSYASQCFRNQVCEIEANYYEASMLYAIDYMQYFEHKSELAKKENKINSSFFSWKYFIIHSVVEIEIKFQNLNNFSF
jgi:hypothetical protein